MPVRINCSSLLFFSLLLIISVSQHSPLRPAGYAATHHAMAVFCFAIVVGRGLEVIKLYRSPLPRLFIVFCDMTPYIDASEELVVTKHESFVADRRR